MTGDLGLRFHIPTNIVFGTGLVQTLPDLPEVKGNRCLILTYPTFDRPALLAEIEKSASFALKSDSFEENPSFGLGRLLGLLIGENRIDTVIAIGGGSTIDAAKAGSWYAANPTLGDSGGNDPPNRPQTTIVAVPTTAGTGSEVSPFAVLSDAVTDRKAFFKHDSLMPSTALCDPDLTVSMPHYVTANTGIDALSHAIEAYLTTLCSGFMEELALGACRRVSEILPYVLEQPQDIGGREVMMMAALEGGIALACCGTVVVHAMGYRMNETIHEPHAVINAMLLPAYVTHLAEIGSIRARLLLEVFGGRLTGFIRNCGLPSTIPVDKVTDLAKEQWVEGAMGAYGLGNCTVPIGEDDVRAIIEASTEQPA